MPPKKRPEPEEPREDEVNNPPSKARKIARTVLAGATTLATIGAGVYAYRKATRAVADSAIRLAEKKGRRVTTGDVAKAAVQAVTGIPVVDYEESQLEKEAREQALENVLMRDAEKEARAEAKQTKRPRKSSKDVPYAKQQIRMSEEAGAGPSALIANSQRKARPKQEASPMQVDEEPVVARPLVYADESTPMNIVDTSAEKADRFYATKQQQKGMTAFKENVREQRQEKAMKAAEKEAIIREGQRKKDARLAAEKDARERMARKRAGGKLDESRPAKRNV